MDRTKIIKRYVLWEDRSKITIVLRSEHYDKSFEYWLTLFEEAKKDFPDLNLKPEQVECMSYESDTHSGQRGIEFNVDLPFKIPDGYSNGFSLITTN